MTNTSTDIKADAQTTATCADGTTWTVARYDTMVVATIGGFSQGEQFATVERAIEEYNDLIDENSTAS